MLAGQSPASCDSGQDLRHGREPYAAEATRAVMFTCADVLACGCHVNESVREPVPESRDVVKDATEPKPERE